MAGGSTFKALFVGDFSGLKKAADGAGDAMEDMAKKSDNATDKLGGVADVGGNTERALMGVGDIAGFVSQQFGIGLGPIDQYAGALAQLGGGVEAALQGGPALIAQLKTVPGAIVPAVTATWGYVTALTAQAVAFIAANAPIIALVAGIGLLVGGVLLAIKYWDEIVAKVPFLGTAATAVKDVVLGAWGLVQDAFQTVLDFARDHWPEIATLLSGPFAPIVLLATDGFGVRTALIDAFQAVLDWFNTAWQAVSGAVSGVFMGMLAAASDAWGVITNIKGGFDSALSYIYDLAGTAWTNAQHLGTEMWSGLKAGVGDLLERGKGLGADLVNGIWNGIQGLKDWLLGKARSFVGDLIGILNPKNWDFPGLSPMEEAFPHAGRLIGMGLAQGLEEGARDYVYPTAEDIAANVAHLTTFYGASGKPIHRPARNFDEQGDDDTLGPYSVFGIGDEVARANAIGSAWLAVMNDPQGWARQLAGLGPGSTRGTPRNNSIFQVIVNGSMLGTEDKLFELWERKFKRRFDNVAEST